MKIYAWYTGIAVGTSELFDVILANPCTTATISHGTSPFSAGSYDLGDTPRIEQSWANPSSPIFTLDNTSIDCGPFTLTFYQALVDPSGIPFPDKEISEALPVVFQADQQN